MTRPPRLVLALALALALGLSGCGDDEPAAGLAQEAQPTAEASATCESSPPTVPPPASVSTDLTKKPALDPQGAPPCDLVVSDVVVGSGAEATPGSTVTVQYVGVNQATGEQFDASWDGGQPFSFELGAGDVIAGWDQGVAGMKVGGRRILTIPPDLAYGDQGVGPIAPGSTLTFAVDLLDVQPAG